VTGAADAIWAALAAAVVGLAVLSRVRPDTVAGARSVARSAVARPAWRLAVFVGWMWLGWHLFAR
jgi:hypothetical protein